VSLQRRTLELLVKAYGSLTPAKAAAYLGLSTEEVVPGILSYILTDSSLAEGELDS
jgi:hypothetical protein